MIRGLIIKVQTPLASNLKNAPALIYNEDRSICIQMDIDNTVRKKMGSFSKKYFEAMVVDGELIIGDEAKAQAW